jgi:hypothetical protein
MGPYKIRSNSATVLTTNGSVPPNLSSTWTLLEYGHGANPSGAPGVGAGGVAHDGRVAGVGDGVGWGVGLAVGFGVGDRVGDGDGD